MATYAIGDIQGCYDELCRLLELINFDPQYDRLWFAGDLVNRGPKSLETLRLVKSLGDAAISVLGNHDIHLLVLAFSEINFKKKHTLTPILQAADSEELLHWLRFRPLLHYDQQYCLIHAGLPPQWDLNLARQMAVEAELALQAENYVDFLNILYGDQPDCWRDDLGKTERIRFAINCFTRLRYCSSAGVLDFKYSCAPGSQPADLLPWYAIPDRKSKDLKIIFGHWSTLGLYLHDNCYAIDTGCLWGGALTALKLSTPPEAISMSCQARQNPRDKQE